MPQENQPLTIEHQLQILDVSLVDVLSHLEALLRLSHTIQRELLQLRSDAPPPPLHAKNHDVAVPIGHADEMQREWAMLGEIIGDLNTGIRRLTGAQDLLERRSGRDRRMLT